MPIETRYFLFKIDIYFAVIMKKATSELVAKKHNLCEKKSMVSKLQEENHNQ